MKRVLISAVIGVAVGGALIAAPYFGVKIPQDLMMAVAAALTMGAAAAVLARTTLDAAAVKTGKEILGSTQIKKAANVISKFPDSKGCLPLSIRPDTKVDQLEVVKHPDNYKSKDILVSLKASSSDQFNPVELKRLFTALREQPGFVHMLLLNKHEEFVGYIPGFYAKTAFTGPQAETLISKYVNDVFTDPNNSVELRGIDGAANVDVISDEASISDAIGKMAGSFKKLVVLHGGKHRKPVGLVNFGDLMGQTLGGAFTSAAASTGTLADFKLTR
jgi:hypothetical protein